MVVGTARSAMTKDRALDILGNSRSLLQQFGVTSVAIFGSVARGEANEASDVDVRVEFDRPVSLFQFVRLQRLLAERLGCRVDLATPDSLKPDIRAQAMKEAIRAA
jgi:predicted nucleotidyltransferase